MSPAASYPRAIKLWQVPLLMFSVGLFVAAAWMLGHSRPVPTLDDQVDAAARYLQQDRPDAAQDYLNELLAHGRLDPAREGQARLLLAAAMEASQRQKHVSTQTVQQRIVDQTILALSLGVTPTADIYRRLAESYEGLRLPSAAVGAYRQAMLLDAGHSLRLQRRVIELELAQGDPEAQATLGQFLRRDELTDAERSWATDAQAHLLIGAGHFAEAQKLLDQCLALSSDVVDQAPWRYWQGYCAWKLGHDMDAQRLLFMARRQLQFHDPLDAGACYILGSIYQSQGDAVTACALYQEALACYPEAQTSALCLLGRGMCRLTLGNDQAGLGDLHELAARIQRDDDGSVRYKSDALVALHRAADMLCARGNCTGALQAMQDEQTLTGQPAAEFYARLAGVHEQHGDRLQAAVASAPPDQRTGLTAQAAQARDAAADAFVACARLATAGHDDAGAADALWRAADLYQLAGDASGAVGVLQGLIAQHPHDARAPEAYLRLGLAYQAAGQMDKAIDCLGRCGAKYPLPLARACIADGSDSYGQAEVVLTGVIDHPPSGPGDVLPQAVVELAGLYCRTGRYEQAIARIEELLRNDPAQERQATVLFALAECYRKGAAAQPSGDGAVASLEPDAGTVGGPEAPAVRAQRLAAARRFYDRVINLYRATPPEDDAAKLRQKLSYFYRADVVFDAGAYEEAVHLYDAAAYRYQGDPSSLAALVQVVNADCALGRFDQAKAANDRCQALLANMTPDAFANVSVNMPKEYWQRWLKWTSGSAAWKH